MMVGSPHSRFQNPFDLFFFHRLVGYLTDAPALPDGSLQFHRYSSLSGWYNGVTSVNYTRPGHKNQETSSTGCDALSQSMSMSMHGLVLVLVIADRILNPPCLSQSIEPNKKKKKSLRKNIRRLCEA